MNDNHKTMAELQAQLTEARPSPADQGVLEMIVCRPEEDQRSVVEQAWLEPDQGLVGDNWLARGNRHTADGRANPDMQITLMNSRIIGLLAGERRRWPLAGDQLYVDLDISAENMPPGQRFTIGKALLEITEEAHTGCSKFSARYGSDAVRFVNSREGRAARRRGVYARILRPGKIKTGDLVTKTP
jgi:MOSC domain-containing protein YiiM